MRSWQCRKIAHVKTTRKKFSTIKFTKFPTHKLNTSSNGQCLRFRAPPRQTNF